MLFSVTFMIVAALSGAPQTQSANPAEAARPIPDAATTTLPSVTITGTPAPAARSEQICRYETVLGSNMRRRTCRAAPSETPLPSTLEAREMLRVLQGARVPQPG